MNAGKRWGWLLCLVLAQEANATSCAIAPMHAQRLAQGKLAESAAVWVGRVMALGDQLGEPAVDWDQRQTVRFEVERWIKGGGGSEVEAVLPLAQVGGVGARLLVFARPNLPDEQIEQSEGRQKARRWQAAIAGAQEVQRGSPGGGEFASALPTLSAGHQCEQRVFSMQSHDAHARAVFGAAPHALDYSADALLWWLEAAPPTNANPPHRDTDAPR